MGAVLVTGGMGKIGSFVMRKLIGQGVRAIAYQRKKNPWLLNDIIDKVEFVEGDIFDLPRIIHTIKNYQVDRVIHMATAAGHAIESNLFMGYKPNVEGGMNVLEACRIMDVKRMVFTSSKAVYEAVQGEYAPPTSKPIDEDYPKAPQNVYGSTKLFIENMGLIYNRVYGLDFVVIRFGSCYGPGKASAEGPAAIRSKIIESAMYGKPIKLAWHEDFPDDLGYHRDFADGVVSACFAQNLKHRVFHLGTGTGTTVKQLMEILTRMFAKVPVELDMSGFGKGNWLNINPCIYNIDRARKELGFNPQFDLEKGVKDYIETTRQLKIPPGI